MFESRDIEIFNKTETVIFKIDNDGTEWVIPQIDENIDYQAYLAWKAEQ